MTWSLVACIALLSALLGGCTTEQKCEPLTRCGGDLLPAGQAQNEWVASGENSCTDDIQLPVIPVSLSQQPSPGAGKKGVGQATADWCSSLAQKPDGSLHFVPFFPIIPLKNAHLTFEPGGLYDAHFITEAPQQMAFSAACRAAQGISFTCPELGRHIKAAIASESNVYNTRCYDDGEGGCTCDYLLSLFTSLPGTWGAADGVVTFYDQSHAPAPPAPTDYCLKGDSLAFTGHDGQQLFNKPGLRTLTMHRPTCSDGLQDQGETGIDCGGPCSPCTANCHDGAQNQDEKGIDCEGICPDFCACFNGVEDPWEEGLDCGGPCSLACSCTNKVHDANEAKDQADCGGDCQARYSDEGPIACPK